MKLFLKGTQMKRIISLLLIISSLLALSLPVTAEECAHNYLREFVSPTCAEKGHTKYSCRRCGYSYKVYDDEYTVPEGFYIVGESIREDSVLTVSVNIRNNPGLVAARLKMHYNSATLVPREIIVGDVWTRNEFTGGLKTDANPLTFFVESNPSQRIHNYNDGTFVTVVFDIIDTAGSYGIGFSHAKSDFVGWDFSSNTTITQTPTIINIVGKSELGPHSYYETTVPPTCITEGYTLHQCSLCNDSYNDSIVDVLPHSFEFSSVITAPTFTTEGLHEYSCTVCNESETRTVPALERWQKGDLNNDKAVNAIDTNLFRRVLVGYTLGPQAYDAADIDGNGELNAMDAYRLKLLVSGK